MIAWKIFHLSPLLAAYTINMEAIIFTGIQATGKSTFYRDTFFKTHIRINLDMLKTRHREKLLLNACLEMKHPFVVDNTNPGVEDRQRYILPAKDHKFRVVGYYFQSEKRISRLLKQMISY